METMWVFKQGGMIISGFGATRTRKEMREKVEYENKAAWTDLKTSLYKPRIIKVRLEEI